jgi:hypothetical protein
MIRPDLAHQIGRVVLGGICATHPECYDFPDRLAEEWWHLLGELVTAPADDVDLIWTRLVNLSEILCDAPARPRQEA